MEELFTKVETKIDNSVNADAQVIVHCSVKGAPLMSAVRVWPSTFLIDQNSGYKSKLIHAEGVVFVPEWQLIPESGIARFTLIFGGLPKSCTSFNFSEIIPEPGGWHVQNIRRNKQDVYRIELV